MGLPGFIILGLAAIAAFITTANAGILAAQIIGAFDTNVEKKLADMKVEMRDKVLDSAKELKEKEGIPFLHKRLALN